MLVHTNTQKSTKFHQGIISTIKFLMPGAARLDQVS